MFLLNLTVSAKRFLLLMIVVFTAWQGRAASYVFDYNEQCGRAYKEFLSLHLTEASLLIKQEEAAHPDNLMAVFLSDYQDCITLLMNGDEEQFDRLKPNLDKRISLIEKGDKNSPWYRACKSGMYMHWAMVYARAGEQYRAAIYFRKAYLLAKDNQKAFPSFVYNKYFLGICETVIGTIPDEYKWLASVLGMKGNVNVGIAKLTTFIGSTTSTDLFRYEAILASCYLRFYLQHKQEDVWRYVNSRNFPIDGYPLNAFVRINIALNYHKTDVALATLQSIQNTDAYNLLPIFDYEMGYALLTKLENNAPAYFQKYIGRTKTPSFIKDAYMQMAQSYYLQDNLQKASYCRRQIKNEGNANTDSDKQAVRFANNNAWTAAPVLKARYLIDGGYYNRALEVLNGYNPKTLPTVTDQLEYYFQTARAYDELGMNDKAIYYYQTTINMGKNRKEHYAARSALQLGFMYEQAGKKEEAIKMYNQCLSMKGHDFQNNIDQQAKAGISRLNS
ncbi:hypothetical protein A9P82_00650 [Arachidicoccus ginsenosidimutans]|uniref:tetratricopeptide repeat protein n=1 Tax=Arachidicoccus sp. BS20 TaxID=1850526 RepID=UPI0007F16D34|nr:tetratricopeptide repeat protein [Arachidicoccus sp. BS20]ANI87955.1 hypothetical protein A9P82_00650 [Arachidicoccus sp. BS20]